MAKAKNLIELLNSKLIVKLCGTFDAIPGKLVEFYGFNAVWAIKL